MEMKTFVKARTVTIKIAILVALLIIYNTIMQAVSPIVANQLAMQQMQNYDTSSAGIQVYQYLTNYGWVVFLVLIAIMFSKDIVNIIKKIKEKMNNEEK